MKKEWRNGTTTIAPTGLDQLMEVYKRFSEIPRPEYDVLLFTQEAWDAAKEHMEARDTYQSSPATFQGLTVSGLPCEIHPGKPEVLMRAMKLMDEGKRVAVCL